MDYCTQSWEPSDPQELLFTDASDFGYGAHLGALNKNSLLAGLWPSDQAAKHTTFKELKVV